MKVDFNFLIENSPNKDKDRPLFTTKEDMMDEWAERTGKPRELLEEMLELHLDYVKHLMMQEDTINIKLPAMGNLILNYDMLETYLSNNCNLESFEKKKIKLKEIKEKYGTGFMNFNRPMILKQMYYLKLTDKRIIKAYHYLYDLYDKLSKFCNEKFNEKYGGGD
jgi:hypothetical protein